VIVAESGPFADHFSIGGETRVVALVGAGGKTCLMYALASELALKRPPVVTTTTTKIYPPLSHESPRLLLQSEDPDLESLPGLLANFGHVTVARSFNHDIGKLEGVSEAMVDFCSTHARLVLVEADGAAGRPIKAPALWEPVIPGCTNLVIPVVGLDCLERPATGEWVFRLDRFIAVTGTHEGDIIGPETVARLLTHPEGALKGVPTGAAIIPFLNAKDGVLNLAAVSEIGTLVHEMAGDRIAAIVVGRTPRPTRERTDSPAV
jgi:probable selenium-dependent hydroxylase accessory protein YqeC